MDFQVRIEIHCGKTTCEDNNGIKCKYLSPLGKREKYMGLCDLFYNDDLLYVKDGKMQRSKTCIQEAANELYRNARER